MAKFAEIGGFLPLDIPGRSPYHTNCAAFNTARNALCWLLADVISKNPQTQRVLLPAFNCPEVEDSIRERLPQLDLAFYNLGAALEPSCPIASSPHEVFYFYNAFGLKGRYARSLPEGTIVDNAHAFFATPLAGHHTVYSARKFFGVPDGAYLYSTSDMDIPPHSDPAWSRGLYLLKRLDRGAREAYSDFQASEGLLAEAPVTGMSVLAQKLLAGLDYEGTRRIRLENCVYLHQALGNTNGLVRFIDEALSDPEFVPYTYPWLHEDGAQIRKRLVDENIFVPTLWPRIETSSQATSYEKHLANNVVHLPIDQRYGLAEMEHMLQRLRHLAPIG
jgi:hypothetical protein